MDPRAMEIAMEQMRRMSPQQMQQMMQNAPKLSPEMMQQAMSQMQNMRPQDWDAARNHMNSMDPSALSSQAAAMNTHMARQTEYTYTVSLQLKNEGNQMHNEGRYSEAVDKYQRAKRNMAAVDSKEGKELLRSCKLNLASCYLRLHRNDDCVRECTEVLHVEPSNIKALYRRGQAYGELSRLRRAAADLDKAVALAAHDPAQRDLIRAKLQDVQQRLEQRGSEAATSEGSDLEDEDDNSMDNDNNNNNNKSKNNDNTNDINNNSSSINSDNSSHTAVAEAPTDAAASMPAAVPGAADMRGGVGLPSMSGMDPAMMKMASEMMANMTPEDMEAINKSMAQMNIGAGAGGGGLADLPPGGMDAPTMQAAMRMMQGMNEESLVDMIMMSGMAKTKEQAAVVARQMKGMSEKQMRMMATAALIAQKGTKGIQQTKEFLLSRKALFIAICILLIGFILRYFDIV